MRLGLRGGVMMAEAQTVIAMRTLGLMGFWPMEPAESRRMVSEKLAAVQEAQMAMLKAVARGGNAVEVTEAALRPVRRRTKANAARLTRKSQQG